MSEHFDVVIVGAGLSGIGAACHLRRECPGKSFALLEGREAIGGTWDLFRYPGIRSDSDMFTFGYSFEPWKGEKALADGPSIRAYVQETARKYGVDTQVRFGHKVIRSSWSSADARWTIEVVRSDGSAATFTANLLWMCTGYYRYDAGHTPEFPGRERFRGRVVHPQHWPEDLDYSGQRVVVIGSGATAVTLVPSMSEKAAHVTMLQRSPSYVLSRPAVDAVAGTLRRVLPEGLAYTLSRWKNVGLATLMYQMARRRPEGMKKFLLAQVRRALGPDAAVAPHFTPSYEPWDQRLCLVPDNDLFKAIRDGKAEVVTDHIETFTETGIRLRSGRELPADLVVTATGLELLFLGGSELAVDGEKVELPSRIAYKGFMLSEVPNCVFTVGYTNASWTLRADLVAEHVCRLLRHMDKHGARQVVPRRLPDAEVTPLLDLSSGYVQRALDRFPKQGTQSPWRVRQNYFADFRSLRIGRVDDPALEFSAGR
jgi:cation diffusion facilitator CzcD-associated flavoprotein CzcO